MRSINKYMCVNRSGGQRAVSHFKEYQLKVATAQEAGHVACDKSGEGTAQFPMLQHCVEACRR